MSDQGLKDFTFYDIMARGHTSYDIDKIEEEDAMVMMLLCMLEEKGRQSDA